MESLLLLLLELEAEETSEVDEAVDDAEPVAAVAAQVAVWGMFVTPTPPQSLLANLTPTELLTWIWGHVCRRGRRLRLTLDLMGIALLGHATG